MPSQHRPGHVLYLADHHLRVLDPGAVELYSHDLLRPVHRLRHVHGPARRPDPAAPADCPAQAFPCPIIKNPPEHGSGGVFAVTGSGLAWLRVVGVDHVIMLIHLPRSEEHTSELQSRPHLVCRLLLEKKKKNKNSTILVNT